MAVAVPFLRRVQVTNYKSIASCDVRLAPLTVLLGPNGAGKSNFVDALRFVADALNTTPADAVARRGGLAGVLRQAPEAADQFSVRLEFVTEAAGEPSSVEYGFTIARDPNGRRPLVVRQENCVVHGTSGEPGSATTRFDVTGGLVLNGGGIERDRLYLPLAATRQAFSDVYRDLRDMLFHHLAVDEMRRLQPGQRTGSMGYSGEHLGPVLGELASRFPALKARVDDYLGAIVPEALGVDERVIDKFSTVELRTRDGKFGPEAISVGTLHAAGVLAALFQPAVLDRRAKLIAIEEPETALHPAAAGALFDALTEAGERVQVVTTTQSADLLDRDDIDPSCVRVVKMANGLTTIADVDEISRRLVEDERTTLGELMRGGQLQPKAGE
ncbi:chromosome segregation protein SMC [Sphaerisporangium siamense]|uniref:Putative ATPase n=1 Tax=Sphaerisporangium siamense TaxID=795645 RepID=A0A7W7D8Y9_9ACTN|nr:AAA family ATPase [Sphaerisporangium siamense]MBB4701585.1 putative ATPase [Sphaerisporangium siamense]GII85711.1 chromosome segregation protein SMC [Sphaerisporangium siamense]